MGKTAGKNKETRAVATVDDQRAVVERMTVRAATIVDQSVEVAKIDGLPEEFKHSETLAGFPPSAKFEQLGDCIFGEFVQLREAVGPNNSRLYELSVPQGDNESMTVAVWGSAALDRLFDSAYPPIQSGDRIAVIYLGEKPTKRGLNPVKLFALKVKHQGGRTQTAQAV